MINKKKPVVSLIFPVKNEGKHIQNTIQSAIQIKTEVSFETIIVDDASEDGSCDFCSSLSTQNIHLIRTNGVGLARAKNLGAQCATGDFFIFCDGHLYFEDFWIDHLLDPIQRGVADATNPCIADADFPNHRGYGMTWGKDLNVQWNPGLSIAFPSPLLAGGCFAISKQVFFQVGGFDQGFRVWGYDDQEISLKLWLFGFKCYVQPKVKILHIFRRTSPPYLLTPDDINTNLLRMAYSHFNQKRINQCKKLIKNSDPNHIEKLVLKSGVLEQREKYLSRRKYNDDWFMKTFHIPF